MLNKLKEMLHFQVMNPLHSADWIKKLAICIASVSLLYDL